MDPQINIGLPITRLTTTNNNGCNLRIIITVVAALLAFSIGVIIGAVTGLFDFLGIGAFVVLIVLLTVILVGLIITLKCMRIVTRC